MKNNTTPKTELNIFPLDGLPEMSRGRAEAKCFELAAGLQWKQAVGRTSTEYKLEPWLGKQANGGRLAPKGFPRNNRFGWVDFLAWRRNLFYINVFNVYLLGDG